MARGTRIPLRSLERLEAGAFDHEPDGFARGFVRTVATAIGLDADETVSRMLSEPELDSRVSISWLGNALIALVLVSVVVALGFVGWAGLKPADTPASAPDHRTELPVRRDAVRALALETGAITADERLGALPPSGAAADAPASDP